MPAGAKPENPVVVAVTNAAYAKAGMVDNWLRSLREAGVNEPVCLYALDGEAARILKQQSVECTILDSAPGSIAQGQPGFRTAAWKRLVLSKFRAIGRNLKAGRAVLFSDLDVVFLRKPLDWLHSQTPADGISLQSDFLKGEPDSQGRLCSGFMYLRPGPRTLGLCALDREDVADFPSDQPLLNHRLRVGAEAPSVELAQDAVPNGPRWRELSGLQRRGAYALHLSYVLGLQQKVKFFRAYGLWRSPHGRTEYWRLRTRAHLHTLCHKPSTYFRNLRSHLLTSP